MPRFRPPRLVPLVILLPLLLGARRPEWGCSNKGRWVVIHTGQRTTDFVPDPALTEDYQFPAEAAGADRIEYYGDSSSMLYVWGTADRSANPSLIGIPYVGVAHVGGERDLESHTDLSMAASGLTSGAGFLRHYDRGECSAFVSWTEFRDQLKNQMDQFVISSGRAMGYGVQPIGNSVFTPELFFRFDTDAGYDGTADAFKFTREYQFSSGPAGAFFTLSFTGGYELAGPQHDVFFALDEATAHDNNGTSNDDLARALRDNLPNALAQALNDRLWQYPGDPSSSLVQSLFGCDPTQTDVTPEAQCQMNVEAAIQLQFSDFHLSPGQTRCVPNPAAAGTSICQVRPRVQRIYEYPEGFELVLAEAFHDRDWELLNAGLPAPPMPVPLCDPARFPGGATRTGNIHAMFTP